MQNNKRILNKLFRHSKLLLFCGCVVLSCSSPKSNKTFKNKIITKNNPIQTNIRAKQIKTDTYNGFTWTVTATAKYEISGVIRSKENYYFGWQSHFSPIDLCLSWGKLNDKNVEKYISYNQGSRWFYFKYKPKCPVDQNYIYSHASNNHIFPKNKNISAIINSVSENSKIILKGYLIKIYGYKKKERKWWTSSLSRSDRGNGACEFIFVDEVVYNNKIYN